MNDARIVVAEELLRSRVIAAVLSFYEQVPDEPVAHVRAFDVLMGEAEKELLTLDVRLKVEKVEREGDGD